MRRILSSLFLFMFGIEFEVRRSFEKRAGAHPESGAPASYGKNSIYLWTAFPISAILRSVPGNLRQGAVADANLSVEVEVLAKVNRSPNPKKSISEAISKMNRVLVHSCFKAVAPFAFGSGTEKIFHRNPNASCRCSLYVSFRERNAKLSQGDVFVVVKPTTAGFDAPEWREVVLTRKGNGPPWFTPITDDTIEVAYCGLDGAAYQRDRIEAHGEMSREVLRKLQPRVAMALRLAGAGVS